MQKNIIMDIIKKLPNCLKKKIFLFDNTYHRIYKNKVINEFVQLKNKLIRNQPIIPVVATGGFLTSFISFITFP